MPVQGAAGQGEGPEQGAGPVHPAGWQAMSRFKTGLSLWMGIASLTKVSKSPGENKTPQGGAEY